MAIPKNDLEKVISDELQMFAEKEYSHQLIAVMLSDEKSSHVSIPIDCMSLFESSVAFAHYLFRDPKKALDVLDEAFRKVSQAVNKNHALKADMVYRKNLHARLVALPNLPEVYRSNLPDCSDVGQFLCIKGTVTRVSTARMLQFKKLWRCSKCKHQFLIEAEVETGYMCEKPLICPNPEWCNNKNFTLLSTDINTDWCKDIQEIKVQEQVYSLSVGSVPKSMTIILENDLVESCHPGNDIIVSGIMMQRWKPLFKGKPIEIELVILAHNVEVQNKMNMGSVSKTMANEFGQFWLSHRDDPLQARDFILSCICPQVFGLYIVKLAVALILAGGVQKKYGNSRIRGDSHLLLIGDPGTAKSQFLKFASKVSPRSVITSGIGTTNAGLTVSAIKESSRWQLEAGALVLADGGVCCIDEFSCIKEQDKTCIHEAMEQQTISVAKAGLVCSLNTRCSILAATNPKGSYDENSSIAENTALGTPLLSRFDIILVLLDRKDENWDEMVSSYILQGRNFMSLNGLSHWSLLKMKNYFSLIRQIKPQVSPEAERVLQVYYTKQRSHQARNASRTTPRLLQSLIRLAEGHARLMFRSKVLVMDAIMSIVLIESSMVGNSILEGISPLLTIFPSNPAQDYEEKAELVLKNLNLETSKDYQDLLHLYQDCEIQRTLLMISDLLISKSEPFIFRNTQIENGSENTFSKNTKTFGYFGHTEEHDLSNSSSPDLATDHFSDDIILDDKTLHIEAKEKEATTDAKAFAFTSTPNPQGKDNLSLLHQLLEEDDTVKANTSSNSGDGVVEHSSKTRHETKKQTIPNVSGTSLTPETKADCTITQSKAQTQRDDASLLMELGISPEKEVRSNKVEEDCSDSHSVTDKATEVSVTSMARRSLADKLMSLAFSKCRNSQRRTLISKNDIETNDAASASHSKNDSHTKMFPNQDTISEENTKTFSKPCDAKNEVTAEFKIDNTLSSRVLSTGISNHNKPSNSVNEIRKQIDQENSKKGTDVNESPQKQNCAPAQKRELPDKLKNFLFNKKRKT